MNKNFEDFLHCSTKTTLELKMTSDDALNKNGNMIFGIHSIIILFILSCYHLHTITEGYNFLIIDSEKIDHTYLVADVL